MATGIAIGMRGAIAHQYDWRKLVIANSGVNVDDYGYSAFSGEVYGSMRGADFNGSPIDQIKVRTVSPDLHLKVVVRSPALAKSAFNRIVLQDRDGAFYELLTSASSHSNNVTTPNGANSSTVWSWNDPTSATIWDNLDVGESKIIQIG